MAQEGTEKEKKYIDSIQAQIKKYFDDVVGENNYNHLNLQLCGFAAKSCLVQFQKDYEG